MKHILLFTVLAFMLCSGLVGQSTKSEQTLEGNKEIKIVIDEVAMKKSIQSQKLIVFKEKKPKVALSLVFTGFPAYEWETEKDEFEMVLELESEVWWLGKECYFTIDGKMITVLLDMKKCAVYERYSGAVGGFAFSHHFKKDDEFIQLLVNAHTLQISLEVSNSSPPYSDTLRSYSKKAALAIGLKSFTISGFNPTAGRHATLATGIINNKGDMIVHTFASGSVIAKGGLELKPPYQIWGRTMSHEIEPMIIEKLQEIIKLTENFKPDSSSHTSNLAVFPEPAVKGMIEKQKQKETEQHQQEYMALVEGQQKADNIRFREQTQLRLEYRPLSLDEVETMLSRHGFYDMFKHASKTFNNQFEKKVINGDAVVVDYATGLMWQQGGSFNNMHFDEATNWIKNINQQGYAGYHDWRLPTLEEGASLIESSQRNGYLYIDPVFSGTQRWIWTGDQFDSSSAWVVNFSDTYGGVYSSRSLAGFLYVRAVRSVQ